MSQSSDNSNLYSSVGGVKKAFPYKKGDPDSKKNAEEARAASDQQIAQAINARAMQLYGRPARPREIQFGILKAPDNRSLKEKIEQDAGHTSGSSKENVRDRSHNYFRDEQHRLEAKLTLAIRPQDKAAIQRRLTKATLDADQFDRDQEAAKQREEFKRSIIDLVTLGESWTTMLQSSTDPSDQAILDGYKQALADLQETGDREAFYEASSKLSLQRRANKTAQAEAFKAQADEALQAAEQIKAERREKPAETPATE